MDRISVSKGDRCFNVQLSLVKSVLELAVKVVDVGLIFKELTDKSFVKWSYETSYNVYVGFY